MTFLTELKSKYRVRIVAAADCDYTTYLELWKDGNKIFSLIGTGSKATDLSSLFWGKDTKWLDGFSEKEPCEVVLEMKANYYPGEAPGPGDNSPAVEITKIDLKHWKGNDKRHLDVTDALLKVKVPSGITYEKWIEDDVLASCKKKHKAQKEEKEYYREEQRSKQLKDRQ